jgi:hypothetical protein
MFKLNSEFIFLFFVCFCLWDLNWAVRGKIESE